MTAQMAMTDIYEFVPFCVTGSGVCQLGELIGQQAYG